MVILQLSSLNVGESGVITKVDSINLMVGGATIKCIYVLMKI